MNDAHEPPDGADDVEELQRALAEARAEATLHRDRYLRARADMENVRKRVDRQAEERVAAGRRVLLLKVLGVMDNLDRALAYQTDGVPDRDSLLTGLRLTAWQFQQLLAGEGLRAIPAVGRPFDPRLHEAVDMLVTVDQPEGTVVAETARGYQLGDVVLRPARVVVAAAPRPAAEAQGVERDTP